MAYYYLVSQLPNISTTESKSNLPITSEQFKELASRFLKEDEIKILENLSLVPSKELPSTKSAFGHCYHEYG